MWRRWDTPENFLLVFIDELWKTPKIRLLKKWKKLLEISSYEVQFLRYGVRQNYLSFWVILYPFTPLPPTTQKTEILTKWKKASGDVIILNLSKKNHDHMMYAYSNMECDRHNFLSFQVIFCSFVPLLIPKIKIWKKM